jgi:hypothetical protein
MSSCLMSLPGERSYGCIWPVSWPVLHRGSLNRPCGYVLSYRLSTRPGSLARPVLLCVFLQKDCYHAYTTYEGLDSRNETDALDSMLGSIVLRSANCRSGCTLSSTLQKCEQVHAFPRVHVSFPELIQDDPNARTRLTVFSS